MAAPLRVQPKTPPERAMNGQILGGPGAPDRASPRSEMCSAVAPQRYGQLLPAESGHAQGSNLEPGLQRTAAAPISGGSRHWQGSRDLDSELKEPADANVDGVVRAGEATV